MKIFTTYIQLFAQPVFSQTINQLQDKNFYDLMKFIDIHDLTV